MKKDKDIEIIDLGSWKVASSWDELDLKTFQEIEKYYSENDKNFDVREVLHILCHKSIDEVNALPIKFTEEIMKKLMFLNTKPEEAKPSNSIVIDGETYSINVMEKLKTGEYVAIDTILKNDPHDYSSIFAVLCRKTGEIFDSKFEAEKLDERMEIFGKQPVMKIMPLIGFFLNLYAIQKIPFLLYSQAEEGLNLIQQSIDSSQKIGAFKRRYLNWRMRKLRKLLKSNKST